MITTFPTPNSVIGYPKNIPNPKVLVGEEVNDNYVMLTQRLNYQNEATWKKESERTKFINDNHLRFLRPYQNRRSQSYKRLLIGVRLAFYLKWQRVQEKPSLRRR